MVTNQSNLYHLPRHELPSAEFREMRAVAKQIWNAIAEKPNL